MPTWLIATLGGLAILAIIGGGMYELHAVSFSEGQLACTANQATDQVKQDTNVKAGYAKIDHNTPIAGNKRTAIKWLSQYTTGNSK